MTRLSLRDAAKALTRHERNEVTVDALRMRITRGTIGYPHGVAHKRVFVDLPDEIAKLAEDAPADVAHLEREIERLHVIIRDLRRQAEKGD